MTNPVLDTIAARRSVRAYEARPLTDEQQSALISAALSAPSAMNLQPWHLILVKNRELLLEMERAVAEHFVRVGDTATAERIRSRGGKIFYNAPTVFFVAMNRENPIDAGILAENIALAATSLGLGSVILGLPGYVFFDDHAYWAKKLQFPDGCHFGISIAVGTAADGGGAPHAHTPGKVTIVD